MAPNPVDGDPQLGTGLGALEDPVSWGLDEVQNTNQDQTQKPIKSPVSDVLCPILRSVI